MKSYEERLPLIDAAIEQGLKEEDGDAVFFGRCLRRFYFGFISRNSVSADYICTRDEFEQRKAELAAKEKSMNDWYERGEFPPVGEKCEVFNGTKWIPAKFVGKDPDSLCGVFKTLEGFCTYTSFRPLRTEHEKLRGKLLEIIESNGNLSNGILADTIIEAGWRPIKPMSEQEFMKHCVDICGHGDARLYRAGCRFIEQVEV